MSAELAYGKLGQPRIYTDKERRERKKEYYKNTTMPTEPNVT